MGSDSLLYGPAYFELQSLQSLFSKRTGPDLLRCQRLERPDSSTEDIIHPTPPSPDPRTVAHWCAQSGWPVHPLAPGRKTPSANCRACAQPGHHHSDCPCITNGRWCHGFHAATTDRALIDAWWSTHPAPGVGVACGPAGLVVIDIDAHAVALPPRDKLWPGIPVGDHIDLTGLENGFHTLAVLAALRGTTSPADDEQTLRVRTPSGGLHVWYQAGPGRSWLCSSGSSAGRALAWQVDIRGSGGYIIAPGTTTDHGTYTPLGTCRTPAPLPQWLAHELTRTGHLDKPATESEPPMRKVPPRARQAVIGAGGGRVAAARALETVLAEVASCATATEGTGFSDKLNRAAFTAGGLIASGLLSFDAAEQALSAAAEHARPGQHHRSASIIRSGLSAGARRPLFPGGRP
ncbi:DNA primase [Streptomyces rimosus]|uniref:bifunctional DNA primase/polymerase n=1 Tax=Streptomyces rimosus TaxID=1927 RepID=UPI0004D453DC|nr:bifunctional DNA primase/polymerase [Streptomyces rimosus]KEF10803.1 DNA primase [Streptomyces rimosus]